MCLRVDTPDVNSAQEWPIFSYINTQRLSKEPEFDIQLS